MSPAGALANRFVLIPCLKLSSTKLAIAPLSTFCPKYGSQRTPMFRVTRSFTRHVSWPKAPTYHWFMFRMPGAPWRTSDAWPTRKSASARPVVWPLKLKSPAARALSSVAEVQCDVVTPKPSWWRPRTHEKSSPAWYDAFARRTLTELPPEIVNALVTAMPMTPGTYVCSLMPSSGASKNRSSASSCTRSEEHTSELQSLRHLVCRLLLEKK